LDDRKSVTRASTDASGPRLSGPSLKGVIFDMDGTLVSSLPLIVHCVNQIVGKYLNRTMTLEEVMATFGPRAEEIIRRFFSPVEQTKREAAVSDYYSCYKHELPRKALLFPGIPQLLAKLQADEKRLAVFTGVEAFLMNLTLESFDLKKHFKVLVSADDVVRTKPDPEGVQLALKKMGLKPGEAAFVGDSPADMISGRKAGVLTIAALWSPENKGDPTTEGPDHQFRSVQELSRFFFPGEEQKEPGFYFSPRLCK
jgi:pyrophosphatase PpaX